METKQSMRVRRARPQDSAHLVGVWERSVRATHHFLTESDIDMLRPLVAALFDNNAELDFWVAVDEADVALGFLGYARDSVEALFIDAAHRGRGVGSCLMAHAQDLSGGELKVEVNEQNDGAIGFYKAQGFIVISRSPVDAEGRPFPILRMRRAAPGGTLTETLATTG